MQPCLCLALAGIGHGSPQPADPALHARASASPSWLAGPLCMALAVMPCDVAAGPGILRGVACGPLCPVRAKCSTGVLCPLCTLCVLCRLTRMLTWRSRSATTTSTPTSTSSSEQGSICTLFWGLACCPAFADLAASLPRLLIPLLLPHRPFVRCRGPAVVAAGRLCCTTTIT